MVGITTTRLWTFRLRTSSTDISSTDISSTMTFVAEIEAGGDETKTMPIEAGLVQGILPN